MPMNSNGPMGSTDRIRKLSGLGAMAMAAKHAFAQPGWSPDSPAAAAPPVPMSPIQQDFHDFTAPQPQPMLPPDRDLNTPVEYNPITGTGYVTAPKRRA